MDSNLIALIAIVIGIILCFFGFKVQKLVVGIALFGLGWSLAGDIAVRFITDSNVLLIIKIVVGLILASLGYKLEKLALAVSVAYLTYTAIGSYVSSLGFDSGITLIIHVCGSLLAGILATFFLKPILIGITSIAGATVIKDYLPTLVKLDATVALIITVVVTVLGLLYQFKSN